MQLFVARKSGRHARSDMCWPEQEQHKAPIEFAFKLGDQLFALEHTGIEPFGGHVEMENRAKTWYAPITDGLKDALGTAALYELYILINAFQNMKKLDIRNTQNALIAWVERTAPAMPQRGRGKGSHVGPPQPFRRCPSKLLCLAPSRDAQAHHLQNCHE
jgi:hypothetical protein